ncbi:amino acid ABC transporter permease [Pseudomonas oryzihabitans]|uniref:amino acid ABC transporter permease n=1 Tax=Pseudomonas oryzihabitans TaxID=47885 RepID=UPI00289510AF|nr:amino acid ABC transporter permease [Pseudomonas oryzihabitans]MDT3723084.1 amino acid ABC transporter permease [Pseudomonas oryzihabitans]
MSAILLALLQGIPWTLAVTATAFVIGLVLGFPLCGLRVCRSKPLRLLAFAVILTLRAIPPIVWLFFIFFGLGGGWLTLSPFAAATLGLGLITAAHMAEVYRGALTGIPTGQYEAALVLNLSARQRFFDVILPQLVRIAIPAAATYAIGLLKDSAIASTLGVTDISAAAYQQTQQTLQGLPVYSLAALLYIGLSVPVALFARRLGDHLGRRIQR